jgi:nucleotide-binding universal stress UspA family protein
MVMAKLKLVTWVLCATFMTVVLNYPTGGEGNLPPAASQAEKTTATAVKQSNAAKYDLVFSTYLGGTDTDTIRGVCADKQGNIIVVGGTTSPDFPTTANALSRTYNAGKKGTSTGAFGPMDAFVTKFDSGGTLNLVHLSRRAQL